MLSKRKCQISNSKGGKVSPASPSDTHIRTVCLRRRVSGFVLLKVFQENATQVNLENKAKKHIDKIIRANGC